MKITIYKLITFLTFSSFALVSQAKDLVLENSVVIIKPDSIPSFVGKPYADYSVVVFKKGKAVPIPFQFDELTEDGFVYIEGVDSVALKLEGVDSDINGQEGIYDGEDELLLMLKDGGEKYKSSKKEILGGELFSEIEVIGYDNVKRYFYLVKGSRILSESSYVFYSADLGRAESTYYSLQVSKKNALVWDDFKFFSYQGTNSQQPIDTMKLGVRANVIPAGFIPVYLNNNNLKATPLAEKIGPIRATTTYRQTLKYLGAPWFASKLQVRHYESKVDYRFVVRMPEARRQMLANLKVRISTDGRELDGSKIVFSGNPGLVGIVDGEISADEEKIKELEPDLDANNWIWLDTDNGFEMFTTYQVMQDTKVESDFNKPQLEFRYEDNKEEKDKPEFHSGQSPDAGFAVKMPQFGKIYINYGIDFFDKTGESDPKKLAFKIFHGTVINENPASF